MLNPSFLAPLPDYAICTLDSVDQVKACFSTPSISVEWKEIHLKCTHCCLRKNKNTLLLAFHNVLKNGPFSLLTMKGLEGKHSVRRALWNLEDCLIKYNRVSKEKLFKDVLKMSVLREAGYRYWIPQWLWSSIQTFSTVQVFLWWNPVRDVAACCFFYHRIPLNLVTSTTTTKKSLSLMKCVAYQIRRAIFGCFAASEANIHKTV